MDNNSIILKCNKEGLVNEVVMNSYKDLIITKNTNLIDYFIKKDSQKFMQSFNQALYDGYFIGQSLTLINNHEVFISFLNQNDTITFLAFLKDNESVDLLEEIIKINNSQTNMIRKLYKKLALNKNEIDNFNELMKLNNQLINVQRDLSKKNHLLEVLNRRITDISHQDYLTGAFNRRKFYEDIVYINAESDVILCLIDFNNFKMINDQLGHIMGDNTLKDFTVWMNEGIADFHGNLYRLGGDEFAVLFLPNSQIDFDKIIIEVEKKIGNILKDVSLAYGYVTIPKNEITESNYEKLEKYIRVADNEMYTLKNNKKNQN